MIVKITEDYLELHVTTDERTQLENLMMVSREGSDWLPVMVVDAPEGLTKAKVNAKVQEIEGWVKKEYRPLFKGKKAGAMGDISMCVQKMAVFLTVYPEYTKEDVLDAAKKYVDSFGNNPTYMRQADYFIFKEVVHQGMKMVTSGLLTSLEDGEEETFMSKDMFESIN